MWDAGQTMKGWNLLDEAIDLILDEADRFECRCFYAKACNHTLDGRTANRGGNDTHSDPSVEGRTRHTLERGLVPLGLDVRAVEDQEPARCVHLSESPLQWSSKRCPKLCGGTRKLPEVQDDGFEVLGF